MILPRQELITFRGSTEVKHVSFQEENPYYVEPAKMNVGKLVKYDAVAYISLLYIMMNRKWYKNSNTLPPLTSKTLG